MVDHYRRGLRFRSIYGDIEMARRIQLAMLGVFGEWTATVVVIITRITVDLSRWV